jgi:hypothetical protein
MMMMMMMISWFMSLLSGVKIYIHTFWIFVSCLWSNQSQSTALFTISNLWIVLGFIFEPCTSFLILQWPFSVTTHGLELF